MDTTHKNELIDAFMGDFKHPDRRYNLSKHRMYHVSWDWIKKVLDRIFEITSEQDQQLAGLKVFELGLFSDLPTVYDAVVEYIVWFNSKNNTVSI